MFKMEPQYIVAGEIVRTSRIYAMSVSPISKSTLAKINGELLGAFEGRVEDKADGKSGRGERGEVRGKRKKERKIRPKDAVDLTNSIKIGEEVFAITKVKGKKLVILPWEKLKTVEIKKNSGIYRSLHGVIQYGEWTFLENVKLDSILSLVPFLDLEGAPEREWSQNGHFNAKEDLQGLLAHLPNLLMQAPIREDKKKLGFLGLYTNSNGDYWFSCSKGFYKSLNQSIASLENLIDELDEEVDIEIKNIVNQTYRRLSDYLEMKKG
jgi:hypothetical protein